MLYHCATLLHEAIKLAKRTLHTTALNLQLKYCYNLDKNLAQILYILCERSDIIFILPSDVLLSLVAEFKKRNVVNARFFLIAPFIYLIGDSPFTGTRNCHFCSVKQPLVNMQLVIS